MKKIKETMIYEDPLTRLVPEGMAKIIHIYSTDKVTGLSFCDVVFIKDGLKTQRRVTL